MHTHTHITHINAFFPIQDPTLLVRSTMVAVTPMPYAPISPTALDLAWAAPVSRVSKATEFSAQISMNVRSITPTNTKGSRTCHCQRGFAGTGIGPNGCQDINDCTTDNGGCSPVARCFDAGGPRVCVCPNNQRGTGVGRYPCYSINEANCQDESASRMRRGFVEGASEFSVRPVVGPTKHYRPCAKNALCRPMTTKEQLETGNGRCVGCRDCFCREGFVGDGWNRCVRIGEMREKEKLHLDILYVSPMVLAVETVETDAAAELTCVAAGMPAPIVEWYRKGITLGQGSFNMPMAFSHLNWLPLQWTIKCFCSSTCHLSVSMPSVKMMGDDSILSSSMPLE